MVKLTLHPHGWKYMHITSVCESTPEGVTVDWVEYTSEALAGG